MKSPIEEFKNISISDIKSKFSTEVLSIYRKINLSLIGGTILFFVVILILYMEGPNTETNYNSEININSIISIFIIAAVIVYGLVMIIPKFYLNEKFLGYRLSKPFFNFKKEIIEDTSLKLIELDKNLMLIRLAMFEFISFLGEVTLLYLVINDNIYQKNAYWLFLTPIIIMAVFAFTNNMSKEKIISRIENDFLIPIKSMQN